MVKPKRGGLGRGLGALIGGISEPAPASEAAQEDAAATAAGERVLQLDPHAIKPNPKQPRREFDEEALQELADSIREDGVVEPIIVRFRNGEYELVSGERRVRASIMAELATIPAIARDVSDSDMLKLGLIENIQREDLNAIELAEGYKALMHEFGWTQEEMAEHVGKKRATVANTLRLLNLPADVQRSVAEGKISMGHARAILALESPKAQSAAARAVVEQGLSVRQVERLAAPPKPKASSKPASRDPHVAALEDEMRRSLGTRVSIHPNADRAGKGRIEIEYYSLDDLDRILSIVRGSR
ncbi:MAG: ParB/RepB/Spo0J family partition protein [Candidatus Hydrogenedentes bacterium]|nr:ParB/RepB/Spo0J family partition protein [Candidatus Hydrogenedentota bacterium]